MLVFFNPIRAASNCTTDIKSNGVLTCPHIIHILYCCQYVVNCFGFFLPINIQFLIVFKNIQTNCCFYILFLH